ncbi:uncharacterized protein mthl1 isoform X1 [Battus philenor]|uniref:uncharacterized protein mthl1 isoform X1 n=1 Tax=Battus philenor TaxID=42288 RepID=UPI0035D0002D
MWSAALPALAWLCTAAAGAKLAPLDVPRCCPVGEQLSADALRAPALLPAAAAAECRAAPPDATAWAPLVYAPARNTFLERGRVPQHWRARGAALPACARLRVLPEAAAHYALLANNASLLVRGAAVALPPARYCADAGGALVCDEDVPRGPAKCCAEGQGFDGARCADEAVGAAAALQELRALANGSAVGFGWPACAEGSRYAVAGALGGARLEADGALRLRAAGGWARLAGGAWCAEAVSGASAGARVLACEAEARAVGSPPHHALYGAGLAVGALFLAATLAAGFALPAAHHALHWRCQTHYVAALMLGDALLAATQLAGDRIPPTVCRILAVCMHFLFLSAFFWLNTMCFNIWWTFRSSRLTRRVTAQGLPADVAGARAGGVPAARVPGVRVGRAAVRGGRGRAAGPAAGGGGGGLLAPALRRASLLVLRRHGSSRLLFRPGGRAAARQPCALRLHHAPAHLRPLAARRGQVHIREGGPRARVRQAGGGDGRDVGRRCDLVGGGRAGLPVVCDGPAERSAGPVHLSGGGVPAARVGCGQARGRQAVRAPRSARAPRRALLFAPALLRGVAHAHHGRPRGACGPRRPRRSAPAHGDGVLTRAAPGERVATRIGTCVQ